MKFGVIALPNAPWDELVRRWRALDGLGFETIWTADHLIGVARGRPWLEGWACLAGMAHATTRTRIGTLVSPITFHNPARLAKASVTVDHMSGGRLELGVGAGGSPLDHELAQVENWPKVERARRLRAFVERLNEVLSDEALQPPPVQARIPLTIGGMAKGTLRLAAETATRWSSFGGELGTDPRRAAETAHGQAELLDRFCREAGREPGEVTRSILIAHPFISETPWRSEECFRSMIARWEGAGMNEIVVYYPPGTGMPADSVEPGLFERLFAKG